MDHYSLQGKNAIVTGAGSGINHELTKRLLEAGCSVVMADLKLRSEAEATLALHPKPDGGAAKKPFAVFHKTDMANWADIASLWETSLNTHFSGLGGIDVVVNGAGIFEPPWSAFWNPPGSSPEARDPADAAVGQYSTFAVNTIGPIRLAQVAVDYWLGRRRATGVAGGNLLWVASMGAYVHAITCPMYFASKAAVVSMVRSLAGLRRTVGIRNAAVCPALVHTPIFDQEYSRGRMIENGVALEADQVAGLMMEVLQDGKYGDGNIVETQMLGKTRDEMHVVNREVPLELLYPPVGPFDKGTKAAREEEEFIAYIQEKSKKMDQ